MRGATLVVRLVRLSSSDVAALSPGRRTEAEDRMHSSNGSRKVESNAIVDAQERVSEREMFC